MNTKRIMTTAQRSIFVLMFLVGGLSFTQANGKNPAQAAGEPAAEFESFLPAEESASAGCTPDADGMRAYWPFDDGPAATTFDDVIENPAFNDGACVGDACPTSTTSGKVSTAFIFDGANDKFFHSYMSSELANDFGLTSALGMGLLWEASQAISDNPKRWGDYLGDLGADLWGALEGSLDFIPGIDPASWADMKYPRQNNRTRVSD